jgi:hypothetical protein
LRQAVWPAQAVLPCGNPPTTRSAHWLLPCGNPAGMRLHT